MRRLCASFPLLFFFMSAYRVTAFLFKQPGRSFGSLKMMSTPKKIALEVEQKFQVTNGGSIVEKRLVELGFRKRGEVDMVDWYFDRPDPNWILTPKDCWLRFREAGGSSSWQLKRGRRHDDGATVYEELEDDDAVQATLSLLPYTNQSVVVPEEYEGHAIPTFPRPTALVPFARIETHRSSWSFSGESESYNGLTVDLDGTQYGHMVGEVEAVVYSDDDVTPARKSIQSLIQEILSKDGSSSQIPVGKLEHYLIRHRPNHYRACVEGGSIQER